MANDKVSNSRKEEKEIWKDIPDYEGMYQASNLGRIRSLDRECQSTNNGKPYTFIRKGRLMKPYNHRQGYKKLI